MKYQSALTPGQVAKLFNVTVPGVHTWIEKGLLRAWRTPGGHRRISRESVDELLRQRDGGGSVREEDNPLVVLVVDDDVQLLQLYKMLMTSWNLPLRIILAESGVDGLLEMAKSRPDFMIIDPAMGDMDGFHLIRKLKDDAELGRMEMISVSSYTPQEMDDHGGLPQSVRQFQKPVPFAHLKKILAHKAGTENRGAPAR